jgi:hypothetical protein
MLPAAVFGYGAYIGQHLEALSTRQMIFFSASSSFDHDDDRRIISEAAGIGGQ